MLHSAPQLEVVPVHKTRNRTLGESLWHHPGDAGLRIAVFGGMHGDEPASARLIQALSQSDHPFWKSCPHDVTFGIGHPIAVARGHRTGPDGQDLNRAFGENSGPETATTKRADLLKAALKEVDIVVDLHQTHRPIAPCAVCPASPAHLDLARQLGATQAVTGTQDLYGDRMLTDWANTQGKLGLTLEVGQVGDPKAYEFAEKAVKQLLQSTEIKPNSAASPLQVWRVVESLAAPGPAYEFTQCWSNGSPVRKGDLIATSNSGNLYASADGALFLPRLGQSPGSPCCVQVRPHSL